MLLLLLVPGSLLLPLVARLLPLLLLCAGLLLDLSEVAFSIGSERFLQKWFLYRF